MKISLLISGLVLTQAVAFKIVEQKKIESGVDAIFPVVDISGGDAVKKYVEREISDFDAIKVSGYHLQISYQTYQSRNFLGFLLTTFRDTHGAHPSTDIKTFNYDKKGLLAPERFQQSELELLSSYCSSVLKPILEKKNMYVPKMFESGIAPTSENYANTIELDDKFIVYFSQYQIAPYVAGINKVSVSKKNLR